MQKNKPMTSKVLVKGVKAPFPANVKIKSLDVPAFAHRLLKIQKLLDTPHNIKDYIINKHSFPSKYQ